MTLVVIKVEGGCEGVRLTPASVRRVTELVHERIEDELSLDEMVQSAYSSALGGLVAAESLGSPRQ
jgi:hypothetical protein